MMLTELDTLLAAGPLDAATRQRLIMDENILGKGSAAAKQSVLRQISNLYDLGGFGPVAAGLVSLWPLASRFSSEFQRTSQAHLATYRRRAR